MAIGSTVCPFCGEAILATAKKCKHCGEWLEQAAGRAGSDADSRGTAAARALTKGLKQKAADDKSLEAGAAASFVISVLIGYFVSWWLGVAVFVGLAIAIGRWYRKE